MVIVDTTVWVDYFNGQQNPQTDWLDEQMDRQRAQLEWPTWLSGHPEVAVVLERPAAVGAAAQGTLVLACADSPGYFWR